MVWGDWEEGCERPACSPPAQPEHGLLRAQHPLLGPLSVYTACSVSVSAGLGFVHSCFPVPSTGLENTARVSERPGEQRSQGRKNLRGRGALWPRGCREGPPRAAVVSSKARHSGTCRNLFLRRSCHEGSSMFSLAQFPSAC